MFISKLERNRFIDYLEAKSRNIKGNMSDKSFGIVIRSHHYFIPPGVAFLMIFGNITVCHYTMFYYFSSAIAYLILGGCCISMLETRFCKDDFNVMDPYLEYLELPINKKSRLLFTGYIWLIYSIWVILVYYFRFLLIKPR